MCISISPHHWCDVWVLQFLPNGIRGIRASAGFRWKTMSYILLQAQKAIPASTPNACHFWPEEVLRGAQDGPADHRIAPHMEKTDATTLPAMFA